MSGPAIIIAYSGVGTPEDQSDGPERAVESAFKVLSKTHSVLKAAIAGAVVLENDPRFNAGTGSSFRVNPGRAGRHFIEMDASLMDYLGNFTAVAGIRNVRNPIKVAERLLDSPHLFLCGAGATKFARQMGFPYYNPATAKARKRLREVKKRLARKKPPFWARKWTRFKPGDTIGVVVSDGKSHFAAANSTGGTSYALPGRVGDSPLIGCGIYAGRYGAVVTTGIGEEIIKKQVAWVVYEKIKSGKSAQQACAFGLRLFNPRIPLGIIAVSKKGYGISANDQMASYVLMR